MKRLDKIKKNLKLGILFYLFLFFLFKKKNESMYDSTVILSAMFKFNNE